MVYLHFLNCNSQTHLPHIFFNLYHTLYQLVIISIQIGANAFAVKLSAGMTATTSSPDTAKLKYQKGCPSANLPCCNLQRVSGSYFLYSSNFFLPFLIFQIWSLFNSSILSTLRNLNINDVRD